MSLEKRFQTVACDPSDRFAKQDSASCPTGGNTFRRLGRNTPAYRFSRPGYLQIAADLPNKRLINLSMPRHSGYLVLLWIIVNGVLASFAQEPAPAGFDMLNHFPPFHAAHAIKAQETIASPSKDKSDGYVSAIDRLWLSDRGGSKKFAKGSIETRSAGGRVIESGAKRNGRLSGTVRLSDIKGMPTPKLCQSLAPS